MCLFLAHVKKENKIKLNETAFQGEKILAFQTKIEKMIKTEGTIGMFKHKF